MNIVQAEETKETTTVYFLNSEGWDEVGAYVYGEKGELLGGWPGVMAESAEDNWVKVEAGNTPAFNIIFFNKANDSERAELLIPDADHVYVTIDAKAYTSQEDAEATIKTEEPAENPSESEESTESEEPSDTKAIYFLNSEGWAEVGAYIYGDKGEVLGGWGSTVAEPADELGGDWVKVGVSELPPYSIIFFNKDNDAQRAELYISEADNLYVTITANSYKSQEAAEAAVYDTETTI